MSSDEIKLKEEYKWELLKHHFEKTKFIDHQISSFNDYIQNGIGRTVSESDIVLPMDKGRYTVKFGSVHIPNPATQDENRKSRPLFPAEARNRDLYYDSPVYVDITEIFEYEGQETEVVEHKRIIIARTPIMLGSIKCNLLNFTKKQRIEAGECEWDNGGYLIIKGKERSIIAQLRGVYNKPIVLEQKMVDKYDYICEVRSMSEETGHSVLIQTKIASDGRNVVFSLPYVKDVIQIGIVFKAMGFGIENTERVEDHDIYKLIGINDHPKIKKIIKNVIRDCYFIKTQEDALKFISKYAMHSLKEDKSVDYIKQVVENELLPHLGITASIKEKAFYLGYMVKKLLCTHAGIRKEDDRDHYINKRVETTGILFNDLFRTLFKRYIANLQMQLEKKKQRPDVLSIISRVNHITLGLRHSCATGNWGVQKNNYIRTGVSQVLSRLTFGATLSHLRRVMIPVGKEGKNAKIRQIHSSQMMYICNVETPEGASIGIVLNMSLLTKVTKRIPTVLVREIVEMSKNLVSFNDMEDEEICQNKTKIFLNGILLGVVRTDQNDFIKEMEGFRKSGLLNKQISFSYNDVDNEINIYSDEGRFIRPLFTLTEDKSKLKIYEKEGELSTNWEELVENGYIQYLDNSEIENKVLAMYETDLPKYKCDLAEICPAMMLGVMASIIPFPDHSQCIFKDEPVYMHDGTTKKICDVKIGDKVITFDPENQKQSITTVVHTETHPTEKQLFEITTYSGRKIIATFDHRFMTSEGWKRLEHLKVDESLIGISAEPKPVSTIIEEYIILDKNEFENNCLKRGIKDSLIEIYTDELSHILPLKSNSVYLPVISRMFGFMLTDGWVGINDNGNVRLAADFGSEYSFELFEKDVQFLKFRTHSSRYTEKEGFGSTYRCEHSGVFPALLVALGIIVGKKSTQQACKIPFWVMNGSDMIKREFLAGFQGGDGSKIKSSSKKQINIQISTTSKTIKTEFLDSMVDMMSDMVKLFRDLGIDVADVEHVPSKDYEDRMSVSYYISSARKNLIKYFEIVNYRYDVYKQIESCIYVEYLKYIDCEHNKRIELVSKIKSFGSMSRKQIAKELNIECKTVYNILKLNGTAIGLPKGLITPNQWKEMIKVSSTTIFMPIRSIIESSENIISDITVDSKNQSFLCGDTFCVHNSPRNLYQSSINFLVDNRGN